MGIQNDAMQNDTTLVHKSMQYKNHSQPDTLNMSSQSGKASSKNAATGSGKTTAGKDRGYMKNNTMMVSKNNSPAHSSAL